MNKTNWSFIRKNAWRRQGPPSWSRENTPLMTFVAQSNAVGFPRLAGLALHVAGDVLYDRISGPLLMRGMKGPNLGLGAHPLSVTRLAWRASDITNDWRWWLYRVGGELARYNR